MYKYVDKFLPAKFYVVIVMTPGIVLVQTAFIRSCGSDMIFGVWFTSNRCTIRYLQ